MIRKTVMTGLTIMLAGLVAVACSDDGADKTSKKESPVKTKELSSKEVKALDAAKSAGAAGAAGFSAAQEERIAALVRKTLVEKPEILQEALGALERKMAERQQEERENQEKRMLASLPNHADTLYRSKLAPVAGNPKGDVTIVEFFDYNCPYCGKAFNDLEKAVGADKNVRVVLKEFPIFGGASLIAAKAALAARKQGKYWEFHSALLKDERRKTEDSVFRTAKAIGLDVDQLKKDMNDEEVTKSLIETRELAGKLGISSTPYLFVGNKTIPGAPRNLLDLIKKYSKEVREKGCDFC